MVSRRERLRTWFFIVLLFIAASAVQVIFYGAPALFGFGHYSIPNALYLPTMLAFFFAPAGAAAWGSVALLRRTHSQRGAGLIVGLVLAVVALALSSAYVGVFVSFNVFGT